MKVIDITEDDHLPCVKFEYAGVEFDLNWTNTKLIGLMEWIEDIGSRSITPSRNRLHIGMLDLLEARYPQLWKVIRDPEQARTIDGFETEEDSGWGTVPLGYGSLTIRKVMAEVRVEAIEDMEKLSDAWRDATFALAKLTEGQRAAAIEWLQGPPCFWSEELTAILKKEADEGGR
jgi:hypothetical protein